MSEKGLRSGSSRVYRVGGDGAGASDGAGDGAGASKPAVRRDGDDAGASGRVSWRNGVRGESRSSSLSLSLS